ncbi:Short C-terminal domain-containing protein [Nonomuraea solani]|uniref:Short C-terminal domain-containing protein n=1 Tax=Nonomuraea solani TaxID=1144553 RepID=A0A1H6B319_9ACTN|nr:DUF4429 domain-containing protein [Nonomuraea solani]SEG55241.1 Short C-terminal domain-containing protein [Nonomuraea solani]
MEDALAGRGCVWVFTDDALRIEPRESASKLLTELGERVVPYAAIADVSLAQGRRGSVVLRVVPRRGADPVISAAAGQLKETADPYRLVLPAGKETLADYYAEEVRSAITATEPVGRFMVAGPSVPRSFKAWDGAATFDGEVITFTWFWSGATSAKYASGDQRYSVDQLEGVEWHGAKGDNGCLRLKVRGRRMPLDPSKDPASVIFGWGHWGATHKSLPFAAAVLAAIPPAESPVARGAEVAELIAKLGALRDAGLLTEEEFQVKKAELLSRM